MKYLNVILYWAIIALIISCNQNQVSTKSNKEIHPKFSKTKKDVTILVQPFADFPPSELTYVVKQLKKTYSKVIIKKSIEFPKNSLNQSKTRHRADSLIEFLSKNTKAGYLTIGLTTKDISSTKGNIPDWGIMGLGYCPGKSCIASSFRLKGKNKLEKLFKVAIHELGHTEGLPHCAIKTCLMRDAKGKDRIDEEKGFCPKCRVTLIKAGWALN